MAPDQEFDNIDPESVSVSGLPNFIPPQKNNDAAAQAEANTGSEPVPIAASDALPDVPKANDVEPVVASDLPNSAPAASEDAPQVASDTAADIDQPTAVVNEVESASTDAGAEKKEPLRSHAGVLIEHGAANYKNVPDEKKSYFVTIETPAGPETIWGVDLARAMDQSGTAIGDPIKLDYMGSELVMVDKLVRDPAGKVIGMEPIETNRNTWEVSRIDHAELDRIASTSIRPGADELGVKAIDPDAQAFKRDAAFDDLLKFAADEQQKLDPIIAAAQADLPELPPGLDRDQKAHEALMDVASRVKPRTGSVNAADLAMVNAALQPDPPHVASIPGAGPTRGQEQVRTGAEALIEGGATLLGGAAALTGTVLKGMGKGAAGLAAAFADRPDNAERPDSLDRLDSAANTGGDADFTQAETNGDQPVNPRIALGSDSPTLDATGGRPPASDVPGASASDPTPVTVLPRLSEYRVDQVDRAANNYEKAHEAFWQAHRMPLIRQEIEARAEADGLSVQDVMEKMKPNGEYADLHDKFNAAVAQSPEALMAKKSMDKALDGWTRQFGRAKEELLNPETEGNPHYEKLKDRIGKSSERMHKNASETPAFEGEQSHIEKLKEAMERIVEKLKEMAQNFVNFVRGKSAGKNSEAGGSDNAPAP